MNKGPSTLACKYSPFLYTQNYTHHFTDVCELQNVTLISAVYICLSAFSGISHFGNFLV